MNELAQKLLERAEALDQTEAEHNSKKIAEPLRRLIDAANEVGKSWCGSWLGYQSRIYYADLRPVPPGARFSMEWGSMDKFSNDTSGDWYEYTFQTVRDAIFLKSTVKSLASQEALADRAKELFNTAREEFLSIATISIGKSPDAFLSRLKDQVEALKVLNKFDFAKAIQPRGQFLSRDMVAASQGFQTPPHIAIIAEATALQDAFKKCSELAKILRRGGSHLETLNKQKQQNRQVGTKVFIGHGRSSLWKDLKDFVQDRLGLPWDEFNRVSIAGITNIARLAQMLDQAAIAFLVMTAEDEQKDGTVRARMNVIHEAGLFQGKLGFTKAIVILEEGCEEFSNIHGLGQIRFPKGNIKAAFEEIRLVLEREEIV